MSKDCLNAMVAGLRGIPVSANPGKSQINFPINGPLAFTGKVVSYEENSGLLRVACDWDTSKIFDVVAKYKGQPGRPKSSEIEAGEFVDFHRVGHGDTEESWVSYFPRPFPVFGIDVFAGSPGPLSTSIEFGKVVTFRRPGSSRWLRTNMLVLSSYSVFSLPGGQFKEGFGTFPFPVLILEGDEVPVLRGTVSACDAIPKPPQIYSIKVVPGVIGTSESCFVFFAAGELSITVTPCCGGGGETEIPPPPPPPDDPPPETDPPLLDDTPPFITVTENKINASPDVFILNRTTPQGLLPPTFQGKDKKNRTIKCSRRSGLWIIEHINLNNSLLSDIGYQKSGGLTEFRGTYTRPSPFAPQENIANIVVQ